MSNNISKSSSGLVAIFDMDNTLMDSQRKIGADVANAMRRLGFEISPEEARTKDWYGMAAKYGVSKGQFGKSFEQRKSWTESLRDGEAQIFPETYETLDRLLSQGVRLGLLTKSDSKYTQEKIDYLGFQRYFGDRIAITPVSEKNKDREAIELMRRLSSDYISRAYFIGDKPEDVLVTNPVEKELSMNSTGLYVNRNGTSVPEEVRDYRAIQSLLEVPTIIGEEYGI